MRIGSDLDACLFDMQHVMVETFQNRNIDITLEGIYDYRIEKCYPEIDEQIIRDVINQTIASKLPAYLNAPEVLATFGFIHFISKRPYDIYTSTLFNIQDLITK